MSDSESETLTKAALDLVIPIKPVSPHARHAGRVWFQSKDAHAPPRTTTIQPSAKVVDPGIRMLSRATTFNVPRPHDCGIDGHRFRLVCLTDPPFYGTVGGLHTTAKLPRITWMPKRKQKQRGRMGGSPRLSCDMCGAEGKIKSTDGAHGGEAGQGDGRSHTKGRITGVGGCLQQKQLIQVTRLSVDDGRVGTSGPEQTRVSVLKLAALFA